MFQAHTRERRTEKQKEIINQVNEENETSVGHYKLPCTERGDIFVSWIIYTTTEEF